MYYRQGRFAEAEPLLMETLQRRKETLGDTHPHTLVALNNLAALYASEGHFGEAETLFEDAMRLFHRTLGETHPYTLQSLNDLAGLYYQQGRYDEAEPFYSQALKLRRETLGATHPDTIQSINNLALVYQALDRYRKAEPLYHQALQLLRETLGETHPKTLASLNNLAFLYFHQGRHDDAETFLEETLQLRREKLGDVHPDTLISFNNLALLYHRQGRHGEAEMLYLQVLDNMSKAFSSAHPTTIRYRLNYASVLVSLKNLTEAIAQLRRMEPERLSWVGEQLYSTRAARVQSQILHGQASFQDIVLTLGINHGNQEALTLAVDVMLRWKKLQGEEQAFLAQLVRTENDTEIKRLGRDVATLRADLARFVRLAQHDTSVGDPNAKLAELENKELALAQVSRAFKRQLEAGRASLTDVQDALPEGSALIEFRQYQPIDFATGESGSPRWAALLLRGSGAPLLKDVGSVEYSEAALSSMLHNRSADAADQAAAALHTQLFGVFESELNEVEPLFVAPDGILSLVPFERLGLANGEYWSENQKLRFIQTGRDLLPADLETTPGRGLLALGGIDFGPKMEKADTQALTLGLASAPKKQGSRDLRAALDATLDQFKGFDPLDDSGLEVGFARAAFELYRKAEPINVWKGSEANEARLKSLDNGNLLPPRVLHLATHGFYLSDDKANLPRPELLSGLTLAGANRALSVEGGTSDDGILYSLEAQDLNLEGTELVVLSACETGQGRLDYSEGVVGLVRAFKIAGAKDVLMTLWPVGDTQAKDFMRKFYNTWLSGKDRTPAQALAMTKAYYRDHEDSNLNNAHTWAPYVLIEG